MTAVNRNTYWRGDHWICAKHLPSVRIPAILESCWYSNCKSKRPETDTKHKTSIRLAKKPVLSLSNEVCNWEKCKQGPDNTPAFRVEGRKYCSHKCRKDRARWTYTQKKKRERLHAQLTIT